MKIRYCSQCQQQSLVPTGGFWACGICRYAITHAALLVETGAAYAGRKHGPACSHHLKESTS